MTYEKDAARNAKDLAQEGFYVIPDCRPGTDGSCAHGLHHKRRKDCGKQPLLGKNWHHKVSSDVEQVRRWWRRRVPPNVGMALEPSGVVVVDTDTPEALAEAAALGLDGGITRYSRMKAFLFRPPEGCPTGLNITKWGQSHAIDLLTTGQVVVFGRHLEGGDIWVEAPSGGLVPTKSDLHDAPAWVVEALQERAASRQRTQEATEARRATQEDDADPPVRLSQRGLKLWRGELVVDGTGKVVPNRDSLDRSATLFQLGMELAHGGATEHTIISALKERDRTLRFDKYASRRDGGQVEYQRMAQKVLEEEPTQGDQIVDDDTGDGVVVAPFPETPWQGLFSDYRSLVGGTTEAPDVYHFWVFVLLFGATLGRRLYVKHATPLFSNFFICLVGRSGLARKDTSWGRGEDLLEELHFDPQETPPDEEPKFQLLPGIGSAEGLLETLQGDRKVVVLWEKEFLNLLAKAKQEGAGNLLPQLTQLYDSPRRHTLRTRARPIQCTNPLLSIATATTWQWLKKGLNDRDIFGGFATRFIFVPGTPKAPSAFPPPPDATQRDHLLQEINSVRLWAIDLAIEDNGELRPTDRAVALFTDWYTSYYHRASAEGLLPVLSARFPSFAWKLALLYASSERSPDIEETHLQPALDAVDWLWEANKATFANFLSTGHEREQQFLAMLRDAPGHALPVRTCYKRLHLPSKELELMADPLARLGLIDRYKLRLNGAKKVVDCYVAR